MTLTLKTFIWLDHLGFFFLSFFSVSRTTTSRQRTCPTSYKASTWRRRWAVVSPPPLQPVAATPAPSPPTGTASSGPRADDWPAPPPAPPPRLELREEGAAAAAVSRRGILLMTETRLQQEAVTRRQRQPLLPIAGTKGKPPPFTKPRLLRPPKPSVGAARSRPSAAVGPVPRVISIRPRRVLPLRVVHLSPKEVTLCPGRKAMDTVVVVVARGTFLQPVGNLPRRPARRVRLPFPNQPAVARKGRWLLSRPMGTPRHFF